ncbi:hypothetical protein ACJMK2_009256 [Sinanodonta woodiana]|uniref:DUF1330 domain-containing protein n=1 Tax=Sinanodonta woodiana TaxID=1069815 RepID=A0ABD3VES0_SINWO
MPGTKRGFKNFGQQAGNPKVTIQKERGVQVGSNEETKKECTVEKKDPFPIMEKSTGDVLLMFRFKLECLLRIQNACVKEKKVIQDAKGTILGYADDIKIYEGRRWPTHPKYGLLVMHFPSLEKAQRWVDSDRVFKQQDWPSAGDSLEVVVVPMHYLPSKDIRAFQLCEMYGIMNSEAFQEQYVDRVSGLLDKTKIYHGVVASADICGLRQSWIRPNTFVVLHCADSIDKLNNFYDSVDYEPYKEFRQRICETDSIMFSIKPIQS